MFFPKSLHILDINPMSIVGWVTIHLSLPMTCTCAYGPRVSIKRPLNKGVKLTLPDLKAMRYWCEDTQINETIQK